MLNDLGDDAPQAVLDFELSPEFRAIHTEAHRRYPDQINPPYLTWHIITALEELGPGNSELDPEIGEQAAINASKARLQSAMDRVNEFVSAVTGDTHRLVEPKANPASQATYIKRDVVSHRPTAFNEAVIFRCEFHREYVTYSFYLPVTHPLAKYRDDQVPDAPNVTDPESLYGGRFSRTDAEVDEIVAEVFENTVRDRWADRPSGHPPETDREFRSRTAPVWDKMFDACWTQAFSGAKSFNVSRIPGRLLGSFRGVVLPRIWMTNAYGPAEADIHQLEWRGRQDRFIPTDIVEEPTIPKKGLPSHHAGEKPRPASPLRWNRVSAGRCMRDNEGLRRAMHWPGGRVEKLVSADPLAMRRTVANLVLNGRALYASALAPPLPAAEAPKALAGIDALSLATSRYCIFYCEEHVGRAKDGISARLDRLILRLHSLANNRLMALRGLDQMPTVSGLLDLADRRLSHLEKAAATRQPLKTEEIKSVYASLNEATSVRHLPDGLMYRSAQSAKYSNTFKRLIDALHIHRIEGWEPYDMFMSRKLFTQFEHIRQLGERAEALRHRLDRVVELAQLETSMRMARSNGRAQWLNVCIAVLIALITVVNILVVAPNAVQNLFAREGPTDEESASTPSGSTGPN